MKNTMSDEKLASKLSDDDKSTVTAKIDETTSWLDANQMAEKEEYEAKQKELEAVVNPILAALGGGGLLGCRAACKYAASLRHGTARLADTTRTGMRRRGGMVAAWGRRAPGGAGGRGPEDRGDGLKQETLPRHVPASRKICFRALSRRRRLVLEKPQDRRSAGPSRR